MKSVTAVLLLAVSSQALALSCKDVKPLTTLDVTQLRGKWNAVEVQKFSNGEPVNNVVPSLTTSSEGSTPPRCVQAKLKVANDSSALMKVKYSLSEDEVLVLKTKFTVSETEKGLWDVVSNVPKRLNEQYLVLAANPDKYVVIMKCLPEQPSAERSPVLISFLSRTPPRDVTRALEEDDKDEQDDAEDARASTNYVPVTEEELKVVRSDVAKLVGLPSISPTKLAIDCFQKKQ